MGKSNQTLKMREFSYRKFPLMRRTSVNIEARCRRTSGNFQSFNFMNENCDVVEKSENSLILENSFSHVVQKFSSFPGKFVV